MQDKQKTPLRRSGMDTDPIKQFIGWLQEAESAEIPQPDAMTLATCGRDGRPSARIVLLRGVDEYGFVFFTNYRSRKARNLEENPVAALTFHWLPLSRQVRVEGTVMPLGSSESDRYFAQRPRGHQIAAHASPQSQVIPDRCVLANQFVEISRKFEAKAVPRPRHWGGYRIAPDMVEFWQEGENRLHDRLRYRRDHTGCWVLERLAP